MLDMGFIPDVERIVGLLPKQPPDAVFLGDDAAGDPPASPTLSCSDPVEIAVAPPASPAETVMQSLVVVEPDDKREALAPADRSARTSRTR